MCNWITSQTEQACVTSTCLARPAFVRGSDCWGWVSTVSWTKSRKSHSYQAHPVCDYNPCSVPRDPHPPSPPRCLAPQHGLSGPCRHMGGDPCSDASGALGLKLSRRSRLGKLPMNDLVVKRSRSYYFSLSSSFLWQKSYVLTFIKVKRNPVIGNHWKAAQNINRVAIINSLEHAAIQFHENAAFVVGGISQVSCMN